MKTRKIEQVNLELTNICNFNCTFCTNSMISRPLGIMDKNLAFKILDEISRDDIADYVCPFLMGEPFLHPDFMEICEYAKNLGLKIKINTNCGIFELGDWKRLFDLNVDIIQISITPTRNDFVLQRHPNIDFDVYISNVKTVINERLSNHTSKTRLIIGPISDAHNFEQNFRATWESLGLDLNSRFAYRNPLDRFLLKKGLRLKVINLSSSIELIFGVLHNWGNNIGVNGRLIPAKFGGCNSLKEQIGILWNGDYTLCCRDYNGSLRFGFNARDITLIDVLNSEKAANVLRGFKNGRLPFNFCRQCRGGPNLIDWFLNQCFSYVYYNLSFHKSLRRAIYTRFKKG